MKFRDKIKFYKQRRILKKIHRCIETIKKYEPTVDGSFFSPVQLQALSHLILLFDEIGYPKTAFVSNYPFEQCQFYEDNFLNNLRHACRHRSVCDAEKVEFRLKEYEDKSDEA